MKRESEVRRSTCVSQRRGEAAPLLPAKLRKHAFVLTVSPGEMVSSRVRRFDCGVRSNFKLA